MLPKSFPDRNVCVLGLGYVGLTLAVAMADAGFQVHGVEVRGEVLDKLARGTPHFHEPGLTEKLQHVMARGRFTFGRTPDGCRDCTVFIITVGTPARATSAASCNGPDGNRCDRPHVSRIASSHSPISSP